MISILTAALLFLQGAGAISSDPLMDKVWGVLIAALVGQAVLGALGLIGSMAVFKRALDKEIPAQLATVNEGLKGLNSEVRKLADTLIAMQRKQDEHGWRIERLENERRDDLDDTRGGQRAPGAPRRRRGD